MMSWRTISVHAPHIHPPAVNTTGPSRRRLGKLPDGTSAEPNGTLTVAVWIELDKTSHLTLVAQPSFDMVRPA